MVRESQMNGLVNPTCMPPKHIFHIELRGHCLLRFLFLTKLSLDADRLSVWRLTTRGQWWWS